MENRVEQLARIMRSYFDEHTKDMTLIELLGFKPELDMLIETLILNGADDIAREIKEDYELELSK